ncbi:hypothetical protein ACFYZJ_30735 [Streptomyces sp. NPDC001848]|uniref:hypothetical protein n=1 Tax=Streptomyces sp. NPDC001848 TaxID=3364618 RepID=UPI0036B7859B
MVQTIAELALIGIPPLCWAALYRTRGVGAVVGAVLLAVAALLGAELAGLLPQRARAEAVVGYAPLTIVVISVGVLVERRLRGRRQRNERARFATVALSWYGVVVMLLFTPYYVLFGLRESLVPSTDLVLPLPPGYMATESSGGFDSCGSAVCSRRLIVTGPHGQPVAETKAVLRDWLTTHHGWHLDAAGSGTQRAGWLLDRRSASVDLVVSGQQVSVVLAGSDGWH